MHPLEPKRVKWFKLGRASHSVNLGVHLFIRVGSGLATLQLLILKSSVIWSTFFFVNVQFTASFCLFQYFQQKHYNFYSKLM